MADWEEIKRLAADFQKVQLGSTTQRLSERNCIEIVQWLLDKKMIDLIFTIDGKEFLTPAHLIKDIKDELYVSGGRINLVDLAKTIGVDLSHINTHVNTVLKNQKGVHLILGQLIDSNYISKIINEINEKLNQQGQLNVGDLTIQYDLPGDFLQQTLEKNLGKTLQAKQDSNDPKIFYTEMFIAKTVSKLRGALLGLTKPVAVSYIVNNLGINDKLFFNLFDQVSAPGFLTNKLPGAQYVPNTHMKSQNEWIQNFYKQNNYLEYDALGRLGLSDYKTHVKKQFPEENLIYLNSCIISHEILDRLLDDIEDCISSSSILDLSTSLPSIFNDTDIEMIMEKILNAQRSQQIIVLGSWVLSKNFLDQLYDSCKNIANEHAKKSVESGQYQEYQTSLLVAASGRGHKVDEYEEKVDKKEERRKKATVGKSGGGAQGRETKTKSTKKVKGAQVKYSDTEIIDNENKKVLELVTYKDLEAIIGNKLDDEGLSECADDVINYILPKINQEALDIAQTLYTTTVADQTANRRQTHNELQNKLNILIGDIRLFEKGIKCLPPDAQPALYKYLLKSLCTDIVNEILNYLALETNQNVTTDNFNNDQRLKFVNELPAEYKNSLLPLLKSLSESNIDEFMLTVEEALKSCSMIIKKIDKKKDRSTILNHKHKLLEELNKCSDLALVLHLALMVVFTTATQCMLHVSGRHLHQILLFLKQYLVPEHFTEFNTYHDYITIMLSKGSEEENVKEKLKEMIPSIRNIANEYKKPGVEKS